ncbi:MAG: type III secretion system inner membrane ring subunit SctD [Endozoicomonas sp.]
MKEFYLKILSGNHQGAEIPLEAGRHSLGRGDTCDLILTDASLHEMELIIELSEEGFIQIQQGGGEEPPYLNGQPGKKLLNANAFDVITSSGLFFTLGPADEDWPDIPLPELQRPAPEVKADSDTDMDFGDEDGDFFPNTEDDEGLPLLESEDEELDAEESEEEYEEGEEFENPLANIDKKWLIGVPASLLVVIILIAMLLISEAEVKKEEQQVEVGYLEQAKEVRRELNQKNIKFKELPDKSILITGYTSTQKGKSVLQAAFQERGIPFSSQLVVMNELRANGDALLKSRGYQSLNLELDNTPGSLVLTGYVSTTDELTLISNMLKQELHGLVSIVDQVENQAGRINALRSMLREKGLSPRVHLIQKPNQISIEGHLLDEEQVYNLNEVATRFRKRYGNRPVLRVATRSNSAPGSAKSQALPPSLQIRGVSMGRVPYVIMEDGQKYLVGAKLVNGYIIEDINLEYLLLSNGTDRIKYRLGGNGGQSIKKR